MSDIEISTLKAEDWKAYRRIRLDALKKCPTSFTGCYQEEKNHLPEYWQKKLSDALSPYSVNQLYFAFRNQQIVGMIASYSDSSEKTKHIVTLCSFYVSEDDRGQGIGKLLLSRILADIQNKSIVTKIQLTVNTESLEAIGIYQKFGFEIACKNTNFLKFNERYYDEYLMCKFL